MLEVGLTNSKLAYLFFPLADENSLTRLLSSVFIYIHEEDELWMTGLTGEGCVHVAVTLANQRILCGLLSVISLWITHG